MVSVRKSLLQLLFAGSFMKRWNDKHRSMDLVEVDKQAHKMMVAWMLYERNSAHLSRPEKLALGLEIVEGGLFEYLYRLVITDIKPPVFYKIKANPDHYRQLTAWVLGQLEPRVRELGDDLWERLSAYLAVPESDAPARRILDAAHLYASGWEYSLIKRDNPWDDELLDIESSFTGGLARFSDLSGVPDLAAGLFAGKKTALGHFARLVGQLRFQTRWSQTPRIPETSVLGHMFLVAAYAYFFSLAVDACPARRLNNFFAGLVHDMPELLTRDIISPVKQSVAPLGGMIKEYEQAELERRVFSVLRTGGCADLADRLGYLLGMDVGSEFHESVRERDGVRRVSPDELHDSCNTDALDPKDGALLKVCDSLAAFIEAYTALRNGITSDQLQQAVWRLRNKYVATVLFGRVHVGALLADFD
ncbi:HD domain-containing protein [Solidesulfovibrio sp.]|uniref:HD domain-containing protein n=1 Tax=Solidesulfovibrio sp. TaxID=2910990 RepID=UPI0026234CFF|nr:HD domain-containing protein [Solidesulfovibrio sp.]